MTHADWAKELGANLRVISLLSAMVLTVYGCSRSPSSYDLASMFDQAQKATPAPDPTGYFREIKSLDLAGLSRNAIFQHPPSTITYSMKVPKDRPVFRASLGLTPDSWDKAGDGVEFVVAIEARGERRERFRRLQMDGDEALARVALDARADITELFDDNGKMLPPKQWPAHLRNSIEAFELKPDGGEKVKLDSKTAARRTILDQTGKLKSPLEGGISALARALRGDLGLDDADA